MGLIDGTNGGGCLQLKEVHKRLIARRLQLIYRAHGPSVLREPVQKLGQESGSNWKFFPALVHSIDVESTKETHQERTWAGDLPVAVAVTCTDGRIQAWVDDFLLELLGTARYDRVYIPGGPGAIVPGDTAAQAERAQHIWEELKFMIEAHRLNRVVLIFHGAAVGGPAVAGCGDYGRLYPGADRETVNRRQIADAHEAKNKINRTFPDVQVDIFGLAVNSKGQVTILPA